MSEQANNPFVIDGPASIGVSGGRTSGDMLRRILRANEGRLPPNVHAMFQNTGDEDERTLEFLARMEQEWGIEIVWLEYCDVFNIEDYRKKDGSLSQRRKKRDLSSFAEWGYRIVNFKTACRKGEPYDMMIDYYANYRKQIKGLPPVLPNVPQRMCTAFLKIKLNARHMKVLGYSDFDMVTGIRADEPKRYHKIQKQNESENECYDVIAPLWHAGVKRPDVNAEWARETFDLALDPDSLEGNCRLCYLKKRSTLITIMRRDIAANDNQPTAEILRWIDREKRTGQVYRRDRPTYEGLLEEAISDGPIKEFEADEPVIDCFCGEGAA